jgi:hypothetical protein
MASSIDEYYAQFGERGSGRSYESRRVLRPGGVIVAAAILRHASLLDFGSVGLLDEDRLTRIRTTPGYVALRAALIGAGSHLLAVGRLRRDGAALLSTTDLIC